MRNPLLQYLTHRVTRVGSWSDNAKHVRVSHRLRIGASRRYDDLGFRLYRTLEKS